jgi:proteic killer suppression protein
MDIKFKNNKLKKIFNSEKYLVKEYGVENSERIKLRMTVLRAANTLAHIPTQKPDRCHRLKGSRAGEYAVDLCQPFRLVFRPDHNPLPLDTDKKNDLGQVTCIKILRVEDYH